MNYITVAKGGSFIDGDGDVVVFIKKGNDFVMCSCMVLKMGLFFLFGEEADEFMEKGQ